MLFYSVYLQNAMVKFESWPYILSPSTVRFYHKKRVQMNTE